MASHSQHQQENSASSRRGGGQAVVELCSLTSSGIIFWSRQRFEIGSELQIRLHRDALPDYPASGEEWLNVRGFVVECPAVRREDGVFGFRVSLLLDTALLKKPRIQRALPLRYQKTRFPGLARMGLN